MFTLAGGLAAELVYDRVANLLFETGADGGPEQ